MPNMTAEREIIDGLLEDAEVALGRGATEKARALYKGILAVDLRNVTALRQLGAIDVNGGDPARALDLFQAARDIGPVDADLCHAIATALRLLGRPGLAWSALSAALEIDPGHAPSLYDRAMEQQRRGKMNAARRTYQQLNDLGVASFGIWFNRGVVLFRLGNLVDAERWFHAATQIDPTSPLPFINLGMIYRTWGYVTEAVTCLEYAVKLAPENPEAHWNLANALLASGDLQRGFAEYEWRFKRAGRGEPPRVLPRWKGEPLNGGTIVLGLEQGAGDAVQFIRFAPEIVARGGRVVVECQPSLRTLLATAPGVSAVVDPGAQVPGAVCYAPLMSVPHLLGTSLETIPKSIPYLSAGKPPVDLPKNGLRVGLVWRGNPQHEHDQWRSISLEQLQPLLDVPGVSFFSLQVGDAQNELTQAPWNGRMVDLSPHLKDFSATAAVIADLDLVISVDTAVAHVAGALGKPVWVLIPQGNDWRWLHGRNDSPWYPTLRLLRQRRLRNWVPAINGMVRELTTVAAAAKTA